MECMIHKKGENMKHHPISRRTFNALAGTGLAFLLPGVARASDAAARMPESHLKDEADHGAADRNPRRRWALLVRGFAAFQ